MFRALMRGAINWAMGDDWLGSAVRHEVAGRLEIVSAAVRKLREQLSACQALDVGLHGDGGKAIVMTRVNGQDRVKIVDIAPNVTLEQYRQIVEGLQATYGAPPRWIDKPAGQSGAAIDHVFTGLGK